MSPAESCMVTATDPATVVARLEIGEGGRSDSNRNTKEENVPYRLRSAN